MESVGVRELKAHLSRYLRQLRSGGRLLADGEEQKKVVFELVNMAGGPPDPVLRPKLQAAPRARAVSAEAPKGNPCAFQLLQASSLQA